NMGVNPETLQIGDHLDRFTTGKFDDVALFDRALSDDEISAISENGVPAILDAIA
ncbi:MAG: LamG domain-containing protein, partial [Akkermansiaceae bacterium]|nr:LamG domain-containing protein [Akkermansiaceae bacterium]